MGQLVQKMALNKVSGCATVHKDGCAFATNNKRIGFERVSEGTLEVLDSKRNVYRRQSAAFIRNCFASNSRLIIPAPSIVEL